MFTFKSVTIIPLSKKPARILVRWQVEQEAADLADAEFIIERSYTQNSRVGFQDVDIHGNLRPDPIGVEADNFTAVSQVIDGLSDNSFIDISPEIASLSNDIVYRVRCRRKSTQEETVSKEASIDRNIDMVGLYVSDEINFELMDVTGVPCLIYNRRSTGVHCTKCFDRIQKKRLFSGCKTCFDTGWLGGFYDPIDSYVDISPNQKNLQMAPWGAVQENESPMMLSNFPVVSPGDVIRELESGRMWRVVRINVTEKRRALMIQFPIMTEIKPGDVEYKIPVDEDFVQKKLEEFWKIKRLREF